MNVDGIIQNARAGACGCGSYERVMRGCSLWGYGPVCRSCRRAWREKHQKPWISEAADRRQRERRKQRLKLKIANYPDHALIREFKKVLTLRKRRHTMVGTYLNKPDEFGLSSFGLSTPLGERYLWLRAEIKARNLPTELFLDKQ